ncbi:ATP-binding protein [Vibrio cholerae]|nr:ATP-binding protein [Vibrio cholerae]EGR2444975.1 ATP-binding protein [Vibrio cholerae]
MNKYLKNKYLKNKCLKYHRRNRKSFIKKKIQKCQLESWKVKEKWSYKLRLYKYPKHKITAPRKNAHVGRRVFLVAPSFIDYYNKSTFDKTNKFINDIVDVVRNENRKVFIDFSQTKKISAAAMLSLLAEVDVLTKQSVHGKYAISFNHPKDEKTESILKQIGFYELVGKEMRDTKEFDDVTFWRYCSGSCSEAIIAKPIFDELSETLKGTQGSKKLYRGFVEAMSNSVEHAYLDDSVHCEEDRTAKWWAFAGIKNNELAVVICDKGVGIPRTLPKTQGVDKINDLLETLGYKHHKVTDGKYIKAATSLTKTRTLERHRGKGLTDIKAVIDSIGKGSLLIFSNKGEFRYKAQKTLDGVIMDHKTSVSGTIIEWTIPLT